VQRAVPSVQTDIGVVVVMSLIPGQVIHGRYRVIALLSPGGMSAVYEVIDTILSLRCALKEMMPYPGTSEVALPQLREQFQQEARLLAELRHPSLPRVTDHFEEDGNVYLVMDYIYGKRLDEVIVQNEGLSEDQVLGWARQLMEALAYCHRRGVIHRDVKPQNVIITSRGQAVLVDFGLAKLVDPNNPRTRTVMQGLGTPEYAPPEQYDTKQGRTDSRTDVYSLGATLYHALVGEPPPMLAERVTDPESLIPLRERRGDVSAATDQAITKAMALQPSERFQDIAEMHEALIASPQLKLETESVAPAEVDATPSAEPSRSTVLLPRSAATRLRIGSRLRATLMVVSFVSLVIVISMMTGRIGAGDTVTPTATAPVTVTFTRTSTATPRATPTATHTPTHTATPTPRPTTRRPTETPEGSESLPVVPVPTSSPTPRQVYVPSPTFTPTAVPTSTPQPQPRRPTAAPTSTPVPTVPTPTTPPTPTPITPTATEPPSPTSPRPTRTPIAPTATSPAPQARR
jgi:serine/threonine protein kinase